MSFKNIAAAAALARGDIANALRAATPGGIEAQEAAGQRTLCANETLPRVIRGATREQLEGIGFVFGEDEDDLFVQCQLPPGWAKRATDHSMHSDLLDEQGRKRAGIFYKAAFYDRSAAMTMYGRFRVEAWGDGSRENFSPVKVMDCDGVVLQDFGEFERSRDGYLRGDELRAKATAWLEERYPDWLNPLAYW